MSADLPPDPSENGSLMATVQRWLKRDPDPDTVNEVKQLVEQNDLDALAERFNARLAFGTAGLRGPLGAGPNRMNELLVRETAAGLADYLLAEIPDAKERGVVVGYDARHKSNQFALATARVMASRGIRTYLFPHVVPTPLVAFGVLDLGVAAGVQVTASHNPPADNGYKVYWGDGPQIVPPLDGGIAAAIDAVASSDEPVELAPRESALIETLAETIVDRYLAGVHGLDPRQSSAGARAGVRVVYTPMHGVGGATVQRVFAEAGFTDFHAVAQQFEPDPDFPTVAFPNPEEKGALDLSLALAIKIGAHIVIANDPDADRMAAAIPDPISSNGWRALRGDEIGWLLADHLLRCSTVPATKQLLVTTIVSSSLLRSMAAARGTVYVETLTGFKWLARAVLQRPELTNVLSYEEALGYCTGSLVLDKDGISAALVMADLAAHLAETGSSFVERLAALEAEFGKHDTEQWSLRFDGPTAGSDMAAFMNRLRADLPTEVAGVHVVSAEDLIGADPPSDVVILRLRDGSRIVVRPSGTEPKCKVYFETVTRVGANPPTAIAELKSALQTRFGLA